MTPPVTILAPAFDEEAVIARFVDTLAARVGADTEILIVDDGSTDRTPEILASLRQRHPSLRVVTHDRNRGMGSALVTGFAAAGGDIIVTLDADLSHPLDLIPELVAACAGADAAFASRFVPGGGMRGVPPARAFVSRAGNEVIRRLLGVPVHDMTTGFRAYRRGALHGLALRGKRFETQLEITVRMVHRGARIVEIPLVLGTRAAGVSKMRYLALLPRYGRMVLRLVRLRWFGR